MRLLITGSRNWEGGLAEYRIGQVLDRFWDLSQILLVRLRLSHGACPTGADAVTQRWADRRGVPCSEFPADWLTYGKQAGPMRNKYMVHQGHDMCVAFLRDNSRGTMGTIALARAAKIPTFVIPWRLPPHEDINDPPPVLPIGL